MCGIFGVWGHQRAAAITHLGLYSLQRLPIDAVPDVTNIQVQVLTVAPSFGPIDIERNVTFPVESSMSGLPGVTQIRSISRFGLSASVWTHDAELAASLASHLEAGTVWMNHHGTGASDPRVPFGGWKQSGIGNRHGSHGIRRFCRTKAITAPRLPQPKSEPIWFPYSARKRGLIRRLYTFLHARGIRNRLGL